MATFSLLINITKVLTSPLLVGQLFEYGTLLSPLNNVHKASIMKTWYISVVCRAFMSAI